MFNECFVSDQTYVFAYVVRTICDVYDCIMGQRPTTVFVLFYCLYIML